MHIAEGVIIGVPAATYTAASLGLVAIGTRRMRQFAQEQPQNKPLLGMAGAFIFFVSLIPIPAFTGTCSHPCGSPLAGILLGPWIGIILTGLSLLLQAAFFAHGGFSTWGANLITLGVGGAVFGWGTFRLARRARLPIWLAGALGGFVGDVMTYAIAGLSLATALAHAPTPQYGFRGYLAAIYTAYLPTQAPIAIGEMVVTGLALHYISQQRPEILEALKVIGRERRSPRCRKTAFTATAILCLMLSGWQLLSTAPRAAAAERAGRLELASAGAARANGVQAGPQEASVGMPGMDAAVNGRLAGNAGRPPRDPYLNTEAMGDLWNTLLLLAGGVCGFVLGRWWGVLFGSKAANQPAEGLASGGE